MNFSVHACFFVAVALLPFASCSRCQPLPGVRRNNFGPRNDRQKSVVDSFLHGWHGYKDHCWGKDELLPVSRNCSNNFGGLGAQIVDALDSLQLMGLDKEYQEAHDWVVENFSANVNASVSLFETTIRILGGLLSAYHLSCDERLLNRAADLGYRMLPAWKETPIPYELVNLGTKQVSSREVHLGSSLAEVGTLQLEFATLSRDLEDLIFRYRGDHVFDLLGSTLSEVGGILPIMLHPATPTTWTNMRVTLGGRGDSFYEYLLKYWLLTNRSDTTLLERYQLSVDAISRILVGKIKSSGRTVLRELDSLFEAFPFFFDRNRTWDVDRLSSSRSIQPFSLVIGMPPDEEDIAAHHKQQDLVRMAALGNVATTNLHRQAEHEQLQQKFHESRQTSAEITRQLVEMLKSLTAQVIQPSGTEKQEPDPEKESSQLDFPSSAEEDVFVVSESNISPEQENSEVSTLAPSLDSNAASSLEDISATPAVVVTGLDTASETSLLEDQQEQTTGLQNDEITSASQLDATSPDGPRNESVADTENAPPATDVQLTAPQASNTFTFTMNIQQQLQPQIQFTTLPLQQKFITVSLPFLEGEEVCALMEQLLANRWDIFHHKVVLSSDALITQKARRIISHTLGAQLSVFCTGSASIKMDHLTCFFPGLLALGVMTNASANATTDLRLAEELAETCAHMWFDTKLGLAPESVRWDVKKASESDLDFHISADARYSILRPETVESLWYLFLATGDATYQDWGWRIFQAIERYGKVTTGGYSGIDNVDAESPNRVDQMETFVLSETFKYLFLLFANKDESPYDLTRVVLNTEGHPLPII